MAKMCGKGMEREEPQNPGSRPLEWAAAVETESRSPGPGCSEHPPDSAAHQPRNKQARSTRDEAEVLDRVQTSKCGQGRGKQGEGIPI